MSEAPPWGSPEGRADLAAAVLEHGLRGRARLRLNGEPGNAELFAKAEKLLHALPGVTEEVEVNAGSLVIHYHGKSSIAPLDTLLPWPQPYTLPEGLWSSVAKPCPRPRLSPPC